MVVTFIGHRKLQFDGGFRLRLKELILALIDDRGADRRRAAYGDETARNATREREGVTPSLTSNR